MKKSKTFSGILALSLLLLTLMAGCAGAPAHSAAPAPLSPDGTQTTAPSATPPAPLLLAAAASLENCFTKQLIPLFQEKNPDIRVSGTYDSSGKLQQQIEEGLEADVFMSAASKQMDALSESGYVDAASVVRLLENQIVLIAPANSGTTIRSFESIGEAASIAIGDPASVPAGQYAQEALMKLGVWDAIQPKLSLGTNVTEVLNQVAEGSADVGIVYATDAAQLPDTVTVLAAAPEGSLRQNVLYPVGILARTTQRQAAERFLAFLQSPEALRIFQENGFITPAK